MILFFISLSIIIIVISLLIICLFNSKSGTGQSTGTSPCPCPCPSPTPSPSPGDKSIVKDDILHIYNNSKSFDKDGLPNGGLLVSLISNSYASGLKLGNNTNNNNLDYPNNSLCYSKNDLNVPNLVDINQLLLDTAIENLTNCFSFDTTYISFDAPGVLFGPILVGRYNYNNQQAKDVYLQDNDFNDYDKLIRSYRGIGLGDCGCGGDYSESDGLMPQGIYNTPTFGGYFDSGEQNWFPKARSLCKDSNDYMNFQYCKDNSQNSDLKIKPTMTDGTIGTEYSPIGVLIDKDYNLNSPKFRNVNPFTYPNGWFNNIKINSELPLKVTYNKTDHNLNMFLSGIYGNTAQPYSRKSFKYFIQQLKNKYKTIFKVYGDKKLGNFFTNSYYHAIYDLNPYNLKNPSGDPIYGSNFYYENEVDLYIPNQIGTTKNGGSSVTQCNVTQEFSNIWKKAVIGIFTNHRCSEDIKGASYQIQNRNILNKNNKDELNDQISKLISEKQILGNVECTTDNPCCCSNNNYQILDEIVIKLVEKWNDNNDIENPKINGYIMNDDMKLDGDTPSDFDTKNITKPLKIKQITNY
jgi:hypothetical protein